MFSTGLWGPEETNSAMKEYSSLRVKGNALKLGHENMWQDFTFWG